MESKYATNVSFILHLKHYPISAMTRTRTRLCVLERDRARDFSQQRLQQADPAAPGVFCNDTHDSLNVRIDWLHMGRYCNTHMYLHLLLAYVLQCVAVCCSVVQYFAVCCSVTGMLQCVAVCYSHRERRVYPQAHLSLQAQSLDFSILDL